MKELNEIIRVENNELFVTLDDVARFSGVAYESVRDLLTRNKQDFKDLGLNLDNNISKRYSDLKLSEPQAKFLLTIMRGLDSNMFKDLWAFVNGDTTKGVVKKTRGVYLIENSGWYKIGIATNISSRLSGIQNGSPFKCTLLHFSKVRNASTVEKILHKTFKEKRGLGEWFKLDDDDIKEFYDIVHRHSV